MPTDLIQYSVHKMHLMDPDSRGLSSDPRFVITLKNLNHDEAHDLLCLLAKMQSTRANDVMLPGDWASMTRLPS